MATCDLTALRALIAERFDGGLIAGCGDGTSTACINQAVAICRGLDVTDDPGRLGLPDIRPINDAPWSTPALRAEYMTLLEVAVTPWAEWDEATRRAYGDRVVVWTVRELIAELPGLPEPIRAQCREVRTLPTARVVWREMPMAAYAPSSAWGTAAAAAGPAALWVALWEALWAARAAAKAETWAALWAARTAWEAESAGSDADAILIRTVEAWIDALEGR